MNRSFLLYFLVLLIFTRCDNPPSVVSGVAKLSEIKSAIKSTYKLKDCVMAVNKSSFTDSASFGTIVIQMQEPDAEYAHQDPQQLTSSAAMLCFQMMSDSEKDNFNSIDAEVTINNTVFGKPYSLNALNETSGYMNTIKDFFDVSDSARYSFLKSNVDSSDISDSIVLGMTEAMFTLDSSYGHANGITVLGFSNNFVTETDGPVSQIWTQVQNGEYYTDFTFWFSESTRKIVYLGINDQQSAQ